MNSFKFNIACILAICLASADAKDVDFSTLEVSATEVKNSEKAFSTPGAVSSREDIRSENQSIDSVVRSLPGSYTQIDQSQGSVSVNIRGLTGLGRVNTMIDGVTQTYYGTSSDTGGVHNFTGNIGTSAFGALIDQNFLVGIDIERGSFSGAQNGLMGSANFRTIGINDVITDDHIFGFLGRYSYGSNGVGPSYMGSVAAKKEFDGGQSLGVLFGYSGKKISQDYKIGGGGKIKDNDKDIDGDGMPDLPTALDTDSLEQRPKSYLFKLEYDSEINKAILTYRRYSNYLAKRDITSDNYQLDYRFDPYSDLIDINLLLSYNKIRQIYDKKARLAWADLEKGMKFKNSSLVFDLSNTFLFDITDKLKFSSKLGINALNNEYKRITGDEAYSTLRTAYPIPNGKQKIFNYYLDNSLEYDIFTFDANLNLVNWKTSGIKGKCLAGNPYCSPQEAGDFKRKDTDLNYSLMASAKIDELFSPFISYERTTRPLNVQELFSSGSVYEDINTGLKPETAKTYQIGFNSHKHGIFSDDDVFGLKAVYYNTKIKNFIYDRIIGYTNAGGDVTMFLARLNDKATLKGFELEFLYDMDVFYAKASYTRQKSSYQPSDSFALDWTNGPASGTTQFSELPKYYATIDVGTRLFNEKLVIGSIAKITGKAKRINPKFNWGAFDENDPRFKIINTQELPKIPTIFDFYLTFEPIKNLTFKFEVQNIFDKNYMDALYTYNSSYSSDVFNDDITIFNNAARGRTILGSFEYRY
ncbi:TonB-dependent receptor domain-containing protein [Campylobacter showae]|uniref:TonB-dependent receptor domain-containing protein n=1 Tax=Campylobacter showae TaxID=204 RepID=UPI000F09A2A8|nr:TonB-dependent receptor [Campylobacter showae]